MLKSLRVVVVSSFGGDMMNPNTMEIRYLLPTGATSISTINITNTDVISYAGKHTDFGIDGFLAVKFFGQNFKEDALGFILIEVIDLDQTEVVASDVRVNFDLNPQILPQFYAVTGGKAKLADLPTSGGK